MARFEVEVQKGHQAYRSLEYDTKQRFVSYWHQLDEVLRIIGLNESDDSLLEIGVGSGFFRQYLKSRDVNVTSLDIDLYLVPSTVGSVSELPFADNSFSVCACYEVLEHLPYSHFVVALQEMRRVTRRRVIISVPDIYYVLGLAVQLPGFGEKRLQLGLRRFPPRNRPKDSMEHYWETGVRGYTLQRIAADIERAGYQIVRTYRVFENPYHRFYVLKCL